MGATLLIGGPDSSWREWLRENLQGRDLLSLDPSDPTLGPPARLTLFRGQKTVAWSFFGGLDPLRAPHVLLAGAVRLMERAAADAVVQLFPCRPAPLQRQLSHLVAEALRPERILFSRDCSLGLGGWPVGPEEVEIDNGFPEMVRVAQRHAQWLKLLQVCKPHEVGTRQLTIEGARIGSGEPLSTSVRKQIGMENGLHAEIAGSSLFIVTDKPMDDDQVARALMTSHCARAHVVSPEAYVGRICAFAREDGEDFGMGVIREIDFGEQVVRVDCDAVAPAPVRILRIGRLRIDNQGTEIEECVPWQI